jgi:thioredoxin reductase (NADPH)
VSSDVRKVIIIGSGPAGYTAAIYAARAALSPLVFEGSVTAGGALMTTTEVENFPGFPEGIMGPELMEKFKKQAARFGTTFVPGDAVTLDFSKRPFTVTTEDETVAARAVIIATGASAKTLGLPGEKEYSGRGA